MTDARCPICAAPAGESGHRPFCSPRCRDRDLLNWLGDAYAMPGPAVEAEASEPLDRSGREPL